MKLWMPCVLLVVFISSCSPVRAQQAVAAIGADDLLNQSKWKQAAAAYQAITTHEPANGGAWQNPGESFLQQHKNKEAIAAFEHAINLPYRPVSNQVNLARAYADANDRVQAIAELRKVVESGNGARVQPIVLASAEFQTLLEAMAPCRTPEYRKFDFWVGDWEVHAPNGGPTVGHNLVTLEQEGCLLVEHWTSSTGGQTGTSFNYYDVRDKKWHQLYLDNSGNAGAFPATAGDLVGGKMVLISDETKSPVSRWTWYVLEPGKVRQMAEQSTDGGKTWSIVWDSVYVKKQK